MARIRAGAPALISLGELLGGSVAGTPPRSFMWRWQPEALARGRQIQRLLQAAWQWSATSYRITIGRWTI
ncbi:MAG: hypothetical protein RMJ48_04065 [Roseiflexaceae bacterium]|nr:hypothetical protein [Roseiflexaceae bacterium]